MTSAPERTRERRRYEAALMSLWEPVPEEIGVESSWNKELG